MMTWGKSSVILAAVILLWTAAVVSGDSRVSCVFLESCVLPCNFRPSSEEIIHWVLPGNIQVHSYYTGEDQFALQNPRFKGRTSLFHDQIPSGNASLNLSGVTFEDEGRYKCYTSTTLGNKESYINLSVEAPVGKVDIELVDDTITCSSRGIYPKPDLTWSSRPASLLTLHNSTRSLKTDQGLYDVNASLQIVNTSTEYAFICSVSTDTRTRTATLTQRREILGISNNIVSIFCNDSPAPLSGFDLTWTFNHSETILHRPSGQTEPQVREQWRQQVKDVSESGTLQLQASVKQGGTYTCELSKEETYVTNTVLKISSQNSQTDNSNLGLAVGLPVAIIAVCIIGGVICWKASTKNGVI